MQVQSINIGQPKLYVWQGRRVESSMKKTPQRNPLVVQLDRIEGDVFRSDVHGARECVVYALGQEAFPLWKERHGLEASSGDFGENLTMDTLDESQIFLGDSFSIGGAQLRATSARIPCFKLNARFNRSDVQSEFVKLRRPGVYFQVLKAGKIQVGDRLELKQREQEQFSVRDYFDIFCELSFDKKCESSERVKALLGLSSLEPVLKQRIEKLFSVVSN